MPVPAATSYSVTDLGTLPGGTQSVAHGLNAVGWVVGTAEEKRGYIGIDHDRRHLYRRAHYTV
jgi:uncharacterized membrane protein